MYDPAALFELTQTAFYEVQFQLAVFSYFSLLNFIALRVQIIVLHFNFIVDKRELKNTCSVDITAICILIT